MNTNQIMILAIVVLSSIIVIALVYLLITLSINKKKKKKEEKLFNPSFLEEAKPLQDVMEKKELTTPAKTSEKFIETNKDDSPIKLSKESNPVPTLNPFVFKPENKEEKTSSNESTNKFFQ